MKAYGIRLKEFQGQAVNQADKRPNKKRARQHSKSIVSSALLEMEEVERLEMGEIKREIEEEDKWSWYEDYCMLDYLERECLKSPDGKHKYVLPPDSFDNPYCKYCYKGS